MNRNFFQEINILPRKEKKSNQFQTMVFKIFIIAEQGQTVNNAYNKEKCYYLPITLYDVANCYV